MDTSLFSNPVVWIAVFAIVIAICLLSIGSGSKQTKEYRAERQKLWDKEDAAEVKTAKAKASAIDSALR
jgi:hypothetical protein